MWVDLSSREGDAVTFIAILNQARQRASGYAMVAKGSEVLGQIIFFLGQLTPEEAAQFAFSEDENFLLGGPYQPLSF